MTEMILVISIMGILASLALSQFTGTTQASKQSAAKEKLERLNQALIAYNSVVREAYKIDSISARSDSSDESLVLLALEFRHSTSPTIGAPYVDPRYRPDTSSNSEDYRIQWSGTMFKLLTPGQSGTGLLVAFDGSDMKTPFPFTDSFRPLGR